MHFNHMMSCYDVMEDSFHIMLMQLRILFIQLEIEIKNLDLRDLVTWRLVVKPENEWIRG